MLEAGLVEFAQHPYPEARTDRVTSGSGVSKGLLFHYFGSKREFYLACVAEAVRRVTASEVRRGGDAEPLEWMVAAAEQRLRQAARQPMSAALVNRAARETSSEVAADVRALLAAAQRPRAEESRRRLTEWAAATRLRPGVDAALLVDAIDLQVAGVVGRHLAADLGDPQRFLQRADSIADELRAHLRLLLHGAVESGST